MWGWGKRDKVIDLARQKVDKIVAQRILSLVSSICKDIRTGMIDLANKVGMFPHLRGQTQETKADPYTTHKGEAERVVEQVEQWARAQGISARVEWLPPSEPEFTKCFQFIISCEL